MKNCKICETVADPKDSFCKKCGLFFREVESPFYASLEHKKTQIYKRKQLLYKEKRDQLISLKQKQEKIKNEIAGQEKEGLILGEKIKVDSQFKDQYIEESNRSEEIQQELNVYKQYLELKNALMKPFHPATHDTRRISYLRNGRALKFIASEDMEKPGIMLVLGKSQLNKRTQDADYFLILDHLLIRKQTREWYCEIPNPLNLKGVYFASLNSMHCEKDKQIPIEGREFQIEF